MGAEQKKSLHFILGGSTELESLIPPAPPPLLLSTLALFGDLIKAAEVGVLREGLR